MAKQATVRALREAAKGKRREITRLERELENAREDLTELEGNLKAAEEGRYDDDDAPEALDDDPDANIR